MQQGYICLNFNLKDAATVDAEGEVQEDTANNIPTVSVTIFSTEVGLDPEMSDVQGGRGGWHTGNGKKGSSSQAQLGQATCLAVA